MPVGPRRSSLRRVATALREPMRSPSEPNPEGARREYPPRHPPFGNSRTEARQPANQSPGDYAPRSRANESKFCSANYHPGRHYVRTHNAQSRLLLS